MTTKKLAARLLLLLLVMMMKATMTREATKANVQRRLTSLILPSWEETGANTVRCMATAAAAVP